MTLNRMQDIFSVTNKETLSDILRKKKNKKTYSTFQYARELFAKAFLKSCFVLAFVIIWSSAFTEWNMIFRRGKRLPGEQLKPNCYFYSLSLFSSIWQTIIESVLWAKCYVFVYNVQWASFFSVFGRCSLMQCSQRDLKELMDLIS